MQSLLTPANLKILLGIVLAILPTLIVAFTKYPRVDGALKMLLTLLDNLSFATHADSPGARVKLPMLMRSKSPTIDPPVLAGSNAIRRGFADFDAVLYITGLTALLLIGSGGCAGVGVPDFAAGPSLPLFVDYPSQTHPVQIAQGAGVEGSVGLFQVALGGKQWDLLDLSAQVWGTVDSSSGTPSGSLSIAPMIGTFNNLVAVGIAVPVLNANNGPSLGSGHPIVGFALSLNIPISFGPYSPPVGVSQGAQGYERGGTIYLP